MTMPAAGSGNAERCCGLGSSRTGQELAAPGVLVVALPFDARCE
jgi:hypothetical protein